MNQASPPAAAKLPRGSYPAMPTAFRDDGVIDWDGVDRLSDNCVETGAAGIFACGLSAEVLQMDDDEKVQLAERIIARTARRIPIVAAAICTGSIETQAALMCRLHDVGADVVAIAVCQLATEGEDDHTWIKHTESLLEQVPADMRLAIYECPLPYWRLLSEQTISWAAATGRFHFLKDTCCDAEKIRVRQEIIRDSRLQLFNANTTTLSTSLRMGVDGFCGIGANFMPELYAWLCDNYDTTPELAAELQRFLDDTVELTEDSTYPVSAKRYLRQRGMAIGEYSRKLPAGIGDDGIARLAEMREREREWLARIAG